MVSGRASAHSEAVQGNLHTTASRIDLTVAASQRRSEHPLIGDSEAMRHVRALIDRLARSGCSVLIVGETGTGKECAAHAIHRASARAAKPLVPINCAAIPEPLLESELFGHAKGAFTGAADSYAGRMVLADGGTMLLDEISEMSLVAQAKILRAVETGEVFPVGGRAPRRVDVRIIAATNRPLEEEMRGGTFRADLYFRLNVGRLALPPLRHRSEDVPRLVRYYVAYFAAETRLPPLEISAAAMRHFSSYAWPGNCRELRNVVEALYLAPRSEPVDMREVIDLLDPLAGAVGVNSDERARIVTVLEECRWNRSQAAARLAWSRMTLYRKMVKYRIASPRRQVLRAEGNA
jgi:two-component system response regulator HydG